MMYANTGAPQMDVIIPMGISDVVKLRAKTSAAIMNIAPRRMLMGTSFQWLVPTSAREMWGIMSPTNPMMPQLETRTAISTEVMTM